MITCLECHKDFGSLTYHVYCTHGLTKKEYIQKYNLPLGYRMASDEARAKMRNWAISGDYIKNHLAGRVCTNRSWALEKGRAAQIGRPPSGAMIQAGKKLSAIGSQLCKERSERIRRSRSCMKCGVSIYVPVTQLESGKRASGIGLRRAYCEKCAWDRVPRLICMQCGNEFKRYGKSVRGESKYCSPKCYHLASRKNAR